MTRQQINVYFGHQVEQLAKQLADQIKQQAQHSPNILTPSQVIVPNGHMQRYLQLYMAEDQGVCANVEFPFLEKGLSHYLNLFEQGSAPAQWSQAELTIRLSALLASEEVLSRSEMSPIARYLAGAVDDNMLIKKRWQLAQRLAVLFINYELQRPEMVVNWLAGRRQFKPKDLTLARLEGAQQCLYMQLFGHEQETSPFSLFQRYQKVNWQEANPVGEALHLFTPTRLSAFHRHLLGHLAKWLPVHIYQLNVCCEFWEDMTTDREDAWLESIKSQPIVVKGEQGELLIDQTDDADSVGGLFFELADYAENPLLKAWGKPGRESLRLFSQLEDDAVFLNVVFQNQWLAGQTQRNDGVLHQLQDSVLYRQPVAPVIRQKAQLKSLQLAQAPSITREVEAVYQNVLYNLQQNPNLQLTDIAILVTDMEKYRFVIEQVFEAQNQQHPFSLSYALIDSSVKIESLYAQAIDGLFDVLENNFVRSSVFKWLANDCVMEALSLADDDLAEWLVWARQLGIFSGYDHLYDSPTEKPPKNPIEYSEQGNSLSTRFTWQQGLQRLRQSLVNDESINLSHDVTLMGQLGWVLETLSDWHEQFKHPMPAQEWQRALQLLVSQFVAVPEDWHKEQQVQMAFHDALEQLQRNSGDQLWSFNDIRQYLDLTFTQISASKGNYLSGGVVCAALQPMRPIPFKITYVLGMDEKSFPGELYQETLDLTQRSRRLGDINAIENMNYLFLETLMCAREKLYLSYVGHDLVKDESIMPSSTWQQLSTYANDLLDNDSIGLNQYPVTRLPLDSADWQESEVDTGVSDWWVNYSPADVRRQNPDGQEASIQQQVSLQTELDFQDKQPPADSAVQVMELAKFLENPVLSYLRQVGGSSQLIDDELNVEHEPFELTGLLRHELFEAAVSQYLAALHEQEQLNLDSAIQQQYQKMASQSQVPIQLFADLDQFSDLHDCTEFISLQDELKGLTPVAGPVVFGEGHHQQTPHRKLPAITATVENYGFELSGSWENLYSQDGVISHQVLVSSSTAKKWHKIVLKPFLFWCMARSQTELNVAEDFQLRVVFRDKVESYGFNDLDLGEVQLSQPEDFRGYLGRLCLDYSSQTAVNLPFDVAKDFTTYRNKREQLIPYLKPSSKAQKIHVFALNPSELSENERVYFQKTYLDKAEKWLDSHDYFEMLKALPLQNDLQALSTYRKRLLPLHVLVEGLK